MPGTLPKPLTRLSKRWQRQVVPASRLTVVVGLVAVITAVSHGARAGTLTARVVGLGALCSAVLAAILFVLRQRRRWRDERHVAQKILHPVDPHLALRVGRAIGLVRSTEVDPSQGSAELARYHYESLLAGASRKAVNAAAIKRASRLRWIAAFVLMLPVGATLYDPLRILEGLDILVARDGHAPLPLSYLERVRVTISPPSHVRGAERILSLGAKTACPVGSTLNLHGLPLSEGRQLVLTDGTETVPLASDGKGGVVGSWVLEESAELRIGARFGEVMISEPRALRVEAEPDESPVVVLEGAPKTLKLGEFNVLELRYLAQDDHGLKQVDLVIASGQREERRPLLQLNGDRVAQGGYALEASGAALLDAFLPVFVSVEARDNDSRGGKWGKSQSIVVVPPAIGAPEASRFRALASLRDELVDLVALDEEASRSNQAKDPAGRQQRLKKLREHFTKVLGSSYGGTSVPEGIQSFFEGQFAAFSRAASGATARLRQSEDGALALDVALQQLARADARRVAVMLADVVEQAAVFARQAREGEAKERSVAGLRQALGLARAGARELSVLGELGADLGSVAEGDLARAERALRLSDMSHTELAARHLAERLRRPNPSFGSTGGGGGSVESGSGAGVSPPGQASSAPEKFNELAGELEQLAAEHGQRIDAVEAALEGAAADSPSADLREAFAQRAAELRADLADLPSVGANPETSRAEAALGREHGRAMAQNMESANLEGALDSGHQALEALKTARRRAADSGGWLDLEAVARAERALSRELEFVRKWQAETARAQKQRARAALADLGAAESELARRAGNLAGRGENGNSALPGEVVQRLKRAGSHMRRAADELLRGEGPRALSEQRAAQRLLESSQTGRTNEPASHEGTRSSAGDDSGKSQSFGGGQVPGQKKTTDQLRERILEGLGHDSGQRLAPAVRRYAEELLR